MDISAQSDRTNDNPESFRTIGILGSMLAVALAVGLLLVVVNDYRGRMAAAQTQSAALATGAAHLLDFEFHNLEAALRGVAGNADRALAAATPEEGQALLSAHVAGVIDGHGELESIAVLSASGEPVFGTRSGASGVAQWAKQNDEADPHALRVGPLRKLVNGRWAVPLAVPTESGGYVLARLRISELQNIVANVDTDHEGVVTLFHGDGTILARSRDGTSLIGTRRPQAIAGDATREQTSPIDGVVRVRTLRPLADYPLVVHAGLSKHEVLAPWRKLVTAGITLYLLYLAGFIYLLHRVMTSDRIQRRLIGKIRESTEDLRLAQKVGGTGSWSVIAGEDEVRWSDNVSNIFGLPLSQASASRAAFYEMVHADDRERLSELFLTAWEKQRQFSTEYRIVRPDGAVRWLSAQGAVIPGRDKRLRMTGIVVDITERMEAQARIADAERQFRLMFEQNPLPFWVFDVQTLRFLEVNAAAVAQYGYTREEFLAMTILEIRPPEFVETVLQDLRVPRQQFGKAAMWVHQRKDGSRFEVRVHAADIDFAGAQARLVLAEDVSDRIAYERQLAYRASHDATTGLFSLDALAQRTDEGVAKGVHYRIAYLELRGLDLIADTLGREASDSVLRVIANRLRILCGDRGIAAHIPADSFALALPASIDTAHSTLLSLVSEPVDAVDMSHHLETWIGFADFPGDGATASEAIRNAALAAHEARAESTPFAHYEAAIAEKARDQLTLVARVRRAIERNEFQLHFQVIRHAADGEPASLEALIRWPQPAGGFIPPSQFIRLCEDSGLIVPLGRWVLRRAAESHRKLTAAGWGKLPIAVNVSTNQFMASDLVSDIASVASEFSLRKGALHIELTESVVMNRPEHALSTMHRLQRQGVCISIDDFGTGFSSMSYLRHLPLDALKIDRSFVIDVDHDSRNASICRALLSLGHSLGLEVIAEGVERVGQYEWLKTHGCDQVQGYLFGMPMPLDSVIEALNGAGTPSLSVQSLPNSQRSGS